MNYLPSTAAAAAGKSSELLFSEFLARSYLKKIPNECGSEVEPSRTSSTLYTPVNVNQVDAFRRQLSSIFTDNQPLVFDKR